MADAIKTKTILKEIWRNKRFEELKKALTKKQNLVNEKLDRSSFDLFTKKNQFINQNLNQTDIILFSTEINDHFTIDTEINKNVNHFEIKQITQETSISPHYRENKIKKQLELHTRIDSSRSPPQKPLICSNNIKKNSSRYKAKSYFQNPYLMEKYLEEMILPDINKDKLNISLIEQYKSPKWQSKKKKRLESIKLSKNLV